MKTFTLPLTTEVEVDHCYASASHTQTGGSKQLRIRAKENEVLFVVKHKDKVVFQSTSRIDAIDAFNNIP